MKLYSHPLVILCYHGITHDRSSHLNDFCFIDVNKFESDMQSICNSGWDAVRLMDGLRMLKNGTLRKPSIAVTFDDGFSESLRLAEAALLKHELHATVFLPTRLVAERQAPWFTKVIGIVAQSPRNEICLFGHRLNMRTPSNRSHTSRLVQNFIKDLHPNASDAVIQTLAEAADVNSECVQPDYLPPDANEIRILERRGSFSFGAHSASHAIHSKMSFVEAADEIKESVAFIRKLTGEHDVLYAYPNGRRRDFSALCIAELIRAGAVAAVTTIHGWNWANTNPYILKRYCVGQNTSIEKILKNPIEKLQGLMPWRT